MGRSNEGLLIAVLIIGFIAVALWIAYQNPGQGEFYPPMSTYSPQPDGTRAIFELAQVDGIPVERFHNSEYDYPPGGSVVVLDSPDVQLSVMLGGELNPTELRMWLEGGGRLLLFSAPMRSQGPALFNELDRAEGLTDEDYSFWDMSQQNSQGGGRVVDKSCIAAKSATAGGSGQSSALWSLYSPGEVYDLASPRPRLWEGVGSFEIADTYVPGVNGHILLAAGNSNDPVVVYRKFGLGEVIWVTTPEIAANSWIDRHDNHRLCLALLKYIAGDVTLYVDEHIHGYRRQHETALGMLFGTRGGQLVLALCLVALMFFLGSAVRPARFKPRAVPPRRQATEMVLAQADLYRRAGAWRNVADSLVDGVRRACMQARHDPRPPANHELATWLADYGAGRGLAVPVLRRYLEPREVLRPRDLADLARECDAVRRALEESGGLVEGPNPQA